MAYLLDANVFITAKNRHYGFDFCPAFWDWLIAENAARRVFSIEQVESEVAAVADDLSDWAAARGAGFFLKPDSALIASLGSVSAWAATQRYDPAAVNLFLSGADCYLVAQGLAHGHTVVTHETPAPFAKKIKIPEACIALGVTVMNPFEMLRRERARFVLAPQA
jgi:hypothetical protein